jgi:formylglycine-generating enzyme required for sulfatase activity
LTFEGVYTALPGTIRIRPKPAGLAVDWRLTGPNGYQRPGQGRDDVPNLPAGEYALEWQQLPGWVRPAPDVLELDPGGEVVFEGVYVENDFVNIPPGTFTMGSSTGEPGRSDNEGPRHQVTLTRGFYMSKYEVTEQRWHQVMGGPSPENPQLARGGITWDKAVEFCNALSLREGLTPAYTIHGNYGNVTWHQGSNGYRLPTEAEWEYGCLAGSITAFAIGPITHNECSPLDLNLNAMGWYCGNTSPFGPQAVGQKQANQWGLYDMHGIMCDWVWCGNYRVYTEDAVVDPVSEFDGIRVARDGASNDFAMGCRSAKRSSDYPSFESPVHGFRPVRSAF